jgi:hypothetical protein
VHRLAVRCQDHEVIALSFGVTLPEPHECRSRLLVDRHDSSLAALRDGRDDGEVGHRSSLTYRNGQIVNVNVGPAQTQQLTTRIPVAAASRQTP